MMKWLFGKFFFFEDAIIRDHFKHQFLSVFWVGFIKAWVISLSVLGAGL